MKSVVSFVVSLVLSLVFAVPAFAQETVKIGVITDRVGFAKPWSEPILLGATYAVRELNDKGGLLGRKVELLVEDDQAKPELSATSARKLAEAGAANKSDSAKDSSDFMANASSSASLRHG